MSKFFAKKNRAFTLVETLVAISIFTVSLLGIMSVLASGISHTNYAKKKITAAYLAQEGIEYMRNMRDTYVLYTATTANDWDDFKNAINSCGNPGNDTKNCYFDDAGTIQSCGNSLCVTPLKYEASNGKYNYTSGVNSGFTRSIQVRYPSGPNGDIKISSIVYWTQGSGTRSITFSENLFNWYE